MSSAIIGYGVKLGKGTALTSMTSIAEVVNVGGPGLARDAVDVTHLNSAGEWREYKEAFKDGGEVSVELNFLPTDTTQELLFDAYNGAGTSAAISWVLQFSDTSSTVWIFTALVTNIEPAVSLGDVIRMSVNLKLTGAPDIGAWD